MTKEIKIDFKESPDYTALDDVPAFPIRRLAFLILTQACKKGAKQINIELDDEGSQVKFIVENSSLLAMTIEPEAHGKILNMFKILTGWLGNIPNDKQVGKGKILILKENQKFVVSISFSISTTKNGDQGLINIIEEKPIN